MTAIDRLLRDIDADRTEMHDRSQSQASKRKEMIAMWEAWATKNQVAYPKRFNMYEYLRKQKTQNKRK